MGAPNLRPKPILDSNACLGFPIHTQTRALQPPDHIPTPDHPSGPSAESPCVCVCTDPLHISALDPDIRTPLPTLFRPVGGGEGFLTHPHPLLLSPDPLILAALTPLSSSDLEQT